MEHKREFWCDTCHPQINSSPVMTVEELKSHLKDVHKLDGRITGSKKLISAMDGDFYQNTIEWRLPGDIRVTEVSSGRKR